MTPSFLTRLAYAETVSGGCLCVGLDPDAARLPAPLRDRPVIAGLLTLNESVIRSTASFAAAYKLNAAFYEAHGRAGIAFLYETVALVRQLAPHAIIIADSKRGDIGNTARFYAQAAFDDLGADAITVAPYMGADSIKPFLDFPDRCAFVLARTSNPGAHDFQHRRCDGIPLYASVVEKVVAWGHESPGTAGLVVGATDASALAAIRRQAPETPLLIPGVGAQGGRAEDVMAAAGAGGAPLLVNSSRGILYASAGDDYEQKAAEAARALRDALSR